MRYLDNHRLYFVHIPKCGGQSLRNALARIEPLNFEPLARDLGMSPAQAAQLCEVGYDHPALGPLHPAHLPLWALREHFPQSWGAFCTSRTVTLVRNPKERFFSALMQRLREFGGIADSDITPDALRAESEAVCSWLAGRARHLDLPYVHFIRQTDFTQLEGKRHVDAVFPLERVGAAAHWLAAVTDVSVPIGHDHARRIARGWARGMVPAFQTLGRRVVPKSVRRRLHPLWRGSFLFSDAAAGYGSVDLGPDVESFIQSHYAQDHALWEQAKQAPTVLGTQGRTSATEQSLAQS